LNFKRYFANS